MRAARASGARSRCARTSAAASRSRWQRSTHASPRKKLQLVSARRMRWYAGSSSASERPVDAAACNRALSSATGGRLALRFRARPLQETLAVMPASVPRRRAHPDAAVRTEAVEVFLDERRPVSRPRRSVVVGMNGLSGLSAQRNAPSRTFALPKHRADEGPLGCSATAARTLGALAGRRQDAPQRRRRCVAGKPDAQPGFRRGSRTRRGAAPEEVAELLLDDGGETTLVMLRGPYVA